MIYPDNFEHKIGFDTVRDLVKERCCSSLGTEHCDLMTFSDDYDTVSFKLHTTAEMQTIIASDEDLNL